MPVKIDLPNGDWAEIREANRLTGGDRRAYKAAIKFQVSTDGAMQEISGDIQERQRNAVLRRLITSWAVKNPDSGQMYPIPVAQNPDDPYPVLDEIPLEIYDILIEAITPHMDRLENAGKSSTTSGESSSNGLTPATPATSETFL